LNAELAKDNSVDELSAADFDLSIIVLLKDINGDELPAADFVWCVFAWE